MPIKKKKKGKAKIPTATKEKAEFLLPYIKSPNGKAKISAANTEDDKRRAKIPTTNKQINTSPKPTRRKKGKS